MLVKWVHSLSAGAAGWLLLQKEWMGISRGQVQEDKQRLCAC